MTDTLPRPRANGAHLPLMLDDAEVELNGVDLKCLTNHLELTPDTTMQTATTFCAEVDYPGSTKWNLSLTLYQNFDDDGTFWTLHEAVDGKVPVPYKIRPTSAAVSRTNPSFEGEVVPRPFDYLNGDAGALSTIDFEWSCTAEPTVRTSPGG